MVCSRCQKRPAVVFVSSNKDDQQPRGYCLLCAKELGIKPVEDIIKKMGISPDDLESVQEQMDSIMENMGEMGDMSEIAQNMGIQPPDPNSDPADNNAENNEEEDGFTPGGAPSFPNFFNMFNNANKANNNADNGDKTGKGKKPNRKNRKHIGLYCEDLTAKARKGNIDNVIGRDKEIERVIQILSRRTKNNPCLIGEPGVGKTAIAEGLALRIAKGNVPHRLKDKEIQLLDLTALIAGTQFRGQYESRIKGLTKEVKEAGNIILFIDEVHNLVGGGDSEGTMNAANILKPALSRGEIQVIGATTFNEYRKYIEKDSALERRFQPVKVAEPSVGDTIDILMGIKGYYENHHNVKVGEDIIRKAAVFSERYITDRFLPDKAIDLLDEACACASLRNKERETYESLMDEKKALETSKEAISGEETVDYEALATVKSELARVDEQLEGFDETTLTAEVTEVDLANVIELWTGIPQSRVRENELLKLKDIEDSLKKKIIGQDEAVDALAKAIKRSRVQISPRRRPASFIFVGPTGVGKTELVKVLSLELFDTPETLIRLDMSEFMEKHSVSKIIGSPPGYVGYDEAGQVTEKVRRRPYSVLLFDEIEKAHPDVMNILLQILDEGKLTDAHGRTVDFSNTVIVMTSNAGSTNRENALGFGKTQESAERDSVMKGLREFLRPEFIARVDEIIIFKSLNEDDFVKIADLMLGEYVETLREKGIEFRFDEAACKYLAEKSCNGQSGARDLRNLIRKEVEDKITEQMILHGEGGISAIALSASDDGLTVETI
ncbi:ATP-dependent Clp protease ATP-binding subunit [uncultured Ruminococcus sp.]|uniref:ATP-dependent Clp protease ATP-binding subunit n=1 Tax=uncultured Ruminococcus sp. TaxID=165186 RepID=UPI00293034C1|nr:ATP-dependent Clp protease ATP-binding subunit [uncultured Ruminococcus sp.]